MKRLVMAPSLSAENIKIISLLYHDDMDRLCLCPPTDGYNLPLLGPALPRGLGRDGGVAAAHLQGQTRAHPGHWCHGRPGVSDMSTPTWTESSPSCLVLQHPHPSRLPSSRDYLVVTASCQWLAVFPPNCGRGVVLTAGHWS